MKKKIKEKDFLPKPEFPGGPKKMTDFIYQNLKYPKDALDQKVEGTVVLKIEIDYKGNIKKVIVKSGLSDSCNKEAVRVAGLLKFNVAKLHDVKVIYFKTLNIQFRLQKPIVNPNQNKNPTQFVINYTITETKQNSNSEKPSPSYNYIITTNKK